MEVLGTPALSHDNSKEIRIENCLRFEIRDGYSISGQMCLDHFVSR